MAWEKLASNKLTSAGDTLIDTTITAKKYLWIQEHKIPTGACRSRYEFNDDTGSNYAERFSDNGGTDGTSTNQSNLTIYHSGGTSEAFSNTFIINKSDKEKIIITEIVEQDVAGSGTAPARQEFAGKWDNVSAQITTVKVFNDGSGSFDVDSEVTIYGTD